MRQRILKFFAPSPRDLSIQTLTVDEIADRMRPVDERSMVVPREFAKTVTEILDVRYKSGDIAPESRG